MKLGSKMAQSVHQRKEIFFPESHLASFLPTRLPPTHGVPSSLFLASHDPWWSLLSKAEQLPTNNNHLFDKNEHLDILSYENIFVRRLSFMTNRNSIGFLSCLTSVKHDKFLIDKIIRFIHLKTFLKQFDSPSIVFQQIGTFICFLFRDNLLRQYQ